MAKFPFLPLCVEAFLADTPHLTDDECGKYVRLIFLMWISPQCRIPNDDEWIRRRMRLGDGCLVTVRNLISEFCQTDGNWIWQKRLRHEWQYVSAKSRRQSVSAKARWDKEKQSKNAMPENPRGNAPTLTLTPTPTPIEENPPIDPPLDATKTEQKNGTRLSPDWVLPAKWRNWAIDNGVTNPDAIAIEFREYWTGADARRPCKKDWPAAWRNWCRREQRSQPAGNGAGGNAVIAGAALAISRRGGS